MNDMPAVKPASAREGYGFTFDFVERLLPQAKRVDLRSGGHCLVAPDDCLLPGFVVALEVDDILSMQSSQLAQLTAELNGQSSGFLWFTDDDSDAYQLAWRARLPCRPISAMFGWRDDIEHGESAFKAEPLKDKSRSGVGALIEGLVAKPVHTGGWTSRDADIALENGQSLEVRRDDEVIALITSFEHGDGVHVSVGGQLADGHKGQGFEAEALKATARHFASLGKKVVTGAANTDEEALKIVTSLGMPLIKKGWSAQLGTF